MKNVVLFEVICRPYKRIQNTQKVLGRKKNAAALLCDVSGKFGDLQIGFIYIVNFRHVSNSFMVFPEKSKFRDISSIANSVVKKIEWEQNFILRKGIVHDSNWN